MCARDNARVHRTERIVLSSVLGVSCLAVATYLAFDWADYGEDSTCGNFIRRAPWTGDCSAIMWHRVFAVIGLVTFAGVMVVVASRRWDRTSG